MGVDFEVDFLVSWSTPVDGCGRFIRGEKKINNGYINWNIDQFH